MSVSSFSLHSLICVSPRKICPDVNWSSPAMQCSKVDFPEPDGPMIAVRRAASKFDADPVQRAYFGLAVP